MHFRAAKPGSIVGCDFAGEVVEVGQEASLVFRYPSTISPESAATLPLATITAGLGLFHHMGLPLPPANSGASVLVWTGSTSVGQYVIQL